MTPHEKAALHKMIADLINLAEAWGEAEGEKYHEDEEEPGYGAAADKAGEAVEVAHKAILQYIETIK